MRLIRASLLALLLPLPAMAGTLTVMSFNIWGGGANEGKGIEETLAAIRAVNPDIIGIQETRLESDPCTADHCPAAGPSVAPALAAALGFHLHEQRAENPALWANAILSRFPIGAPSPNDLGVPITVEGKTVWAFNIHLDDAPYQPYQLLKIEYGDAPFIATEAEAIRAAAETRGPALALLAADMKAAEGAAAAFVFGDFNEPSHRDWTAEAAAKGTHPIAVAWPTTRAVESMGFTDAFRAVFPDPVARPAFTWTPAGDPADPEDHHDRIDFVFARAPGLVVEAAGIVGEKAPEAEVVVTPWPADHRAVFARIRY